VSVNQASGTAYSLCDGNVISIDPQRVTTYLYTSSTLRDLAVDEATGGIFVTDGDALVVLSDASRPMAADVCGSTEGTYASGESVTFTIDMQLDCARFAADFPVPSGSSPPWLQLGLDLTAAIEQSLGCTDQVSVGGSLSDFSCVPGSNGAQTRVVGRFVESGAHSYKPSDIAACLSARSKQQSFASGAVLSALVVGSEVTQAPPAASSSSGSSLSVLIPIIVAPALIWVAIGVLVCFCCRRRRRALEALRAKSASQQRGVGIAEVQLQGMPTQTYGQAPTGHMQHV